MSEVKSEIPTVPSEPVVAKSIEPPAKKIMTEAKRAALQKANEARALKHQKKKVIEEEYERDLKQLNALYGNMKDKWEKMEPEVLLEKMKKPERDVAVKEELKPVKQVEKAKPKVEFEESKSSEEESEDGYESPPPPPRQKAPPVPSKPQRKVAQIYQDDLEALIAHAQRTTQQARDPPRQEPPQPKVYKPKYLFDTFTPMYD